MEKRLLVIRTNSREAGEFGKRRGKAPSDKIVGGAEATFVAALRTSCRLHEVPKDILPDHEQLYILQVLETSAPRPITELGREVSRGKALIAFKTRRFTVSSSEPVSPGGVSYAKSISPGIIMFTALARRRGAARRRATRRTIRDSGVLRATRR